jgi:hypothetical protein
MVCGVFWDIVCALLRPESFLSGRGLNFLIQIFLLYLLYYNRDLLRYLFNMFLRRGSWSFNMMVVMVVMMMLSFLMTAVISLSRLRFRCCVHSSILFLLLILSNS